MEENVLSDEVSNGTMQHIDIKIGHECPVLSPADHYALDKTSFVLEGNINCIYEILITSIN